MSRLIIPLLLLFGIFGCGTMFDRGKDRDSSSQYKITLPPKVSIEFPEVLKRDSDENISTGYRRLKDDIAEVEWSQNTSKIYRLLAEQIIQEVEQKCQSVKIDTRCVIEAEELSIVFDNKFMRDFEAITGEEPSGIIQELKDKPIALGEIEFIEYNSTQKYHYDLTMETTPVTKAFGMDKESTQTIKWSKDEKNVLTYVADESNRTITSMETTYREDERGEREMSIDMRYEGKLSIDTAKFTLNLIERNDTNETFDITTDTVTQEFYSEELHDYNSSSVGQISNQGGYLAIVEVFDYKFHKEYYLFDANGTIIFSRYCPDVMEEELCLDKSR